MGVKSDATGGDCLESSALTLGSMHYTHRAGPWRYRRGFHTHAWEIWAATHGSSRFTLGRRTVIMPAGHFLVIPPGMTHQQHVAQKDSVLGLVAHFFIDRPAPHLKKLAGKPLPVPPLGRALLVKMVDYPPRTEVEIVRWRCWLAAMLNELMQPSTDDGQSLTWTQRVPMGTDESSWSLTHQVIEFLRGQLPRPTGCMARLGEHLGYTPHHLNRLFKRETGISLLETFQRLRLEEATRLLRTSPLKVQAVAMHLGFRQPHKFNAFFKSRMQCTPTEFIKQRRRLGWAMPAMHSHPLMDEVFTDKRRRG